MTPANQSFGGSWTHEKLERLRKYLAAYVQIMKGQAWCEAFCYIDAFAGTGYNLPKEAADEKEDFADLLPEVVANDTQNFLTTSVRVALETQPPFSEYHFIEKHRGRASDLESLRKDYPALADRIHAVPGDANEQIQRICTEWNWRRRRAVLFLDPFGMQVSWKTIECVAATHAIDMWLLFPAGIGVNRMLPGHGKIPESWCKRLDNFFGVSRQEWEKEFYRESEDDLFGHSTKKKTATIESIGQFFVQRLKTVFPHVPSRPLELCNDGGTSLYLLCFAAENANARKIANDLLKSS